MKKIYIGTLALVVMLSACGAPLRPSLPATTATTASTQTAIPTATRTPRPTATPSKPISPEASAYLEEAIKIMEENSINRNEIDWDSQRTRAFKMAEHAQTPKDTYYAISMVLKLAGGQHSRFLPPSEAQKSQQMTAGDSPPPRGKLLLGKLGYIEIKSFQSIMHGEGEKYASEIQRIIRDLDTQGACGWMIDLRENPGGNMWPMLAGLGPIIGEGKVGSFMDPDGNEVPWFYQDGKSMIGDEVLVQVTGEPYHFEKPEPVAVFTGTGTASSGEAIVVAFIGRPQTRSFGLYTAGLSTGNSGFELSDGAVLILTGVIFADRNGNTYGKRILPDQYVDTVQEVTIIDDEKIYQSAVDWLLDQPTCQDPT